MMRTTFGAPPGAAARRGRGAGAGAGPSCAPPAHAAARSATTTAATPGCVSAERRGSAPHLLQEHVADDAEARDGEGERRAHAGERESEAVGAEHGGDHARA